MTELQPMRRSLPGWTAEDPVPPPCPLETPSGSSTLCPSHTETSKGGSLALFLGTHLKGKNDPMLFWPSHSRKLFCGRYKGHFSNLWAKIHENEG